MIIKEILQKNINKLKQNNISTPHLDAEILLSYILKKPREHILTYSNFELNNKQIIKFEKLIQERLKNKPIAYLINYKSFYNLDFYVNKNVLIPRPETELMIDEAILKIQKTKNKNDWLIVDIGTGSGCIIISIAKNLLNNKKYNFLAIDISKQALKIANQNAKLNKINKKINFIDGNLLLPFLKNKKLKTKKYNLIILANLPYLTPNQIKKSPTIQYEPQIALTAENDGLKYYKKLFFQISKLSLNNYNQITSICEFDSSQTQKIRDISKKYLPNYKIKIKKDLSKKNRFIILS